MDENERLRGLVTQLEAEMIALRSMLPWMIASISVQSVDDPLEAIRTLHQASLHTLAAFHMPGDADKMLALREQASVVIDSILSSISLKPGA